MPLCECGCGAEVNNRFVSGHNRASQKPRINPDGPDFLIEDRGYKTPCHIWNHGLAKAGYGDRRLPGIETTLVHKQNWEAKHGPVPDGCELDHLCGVRSCGNEDHLEPVSHTINIRRGRRSKLTESLVREAIIRCATGESRISVARSFGVDPSTISEAVRGIGWKGVGDTLPRNDQKVTWNNIFEMYIRSAAGESQGEIGLRFNVHRNHVNNILRGIAWRLPEVA